jgi:hypothetical protein
MLTKVFDLGQMSYLVEIYTSAVGYEPEHAMPVVFHFACAVDFEWTELEHPLLERIKVLQESNGRVDVILAA